MKIKLVTGQRYGNLKKAVVEGIDTIWYPEEKEIHNYDLVEEILELCDKYYNTDKDLIIVTYCECVLDAMRLWGARTKHCDILECHNVMNDGEIHIAKFNEFGEMEFWENGVFDIKSVILRELFETRRMN